MTDKEAIAAVERGERVTGAFSVHATDLKISMCRHSWRTLFCDFETDVLECQNCGRQRLGRCTFDDDMA